MMLATPVRSREWSSTTSTRAGPGTTPIAAPRDSTIAIGCLLCSRDRERRRLPGEHDLGAGPRCGHEGQRGPDALGALAHAGHAETTAAEVAGDPAAVVGHRQAEADAADGPGTHHDAARVGMADGVGQRLLRDAEDLAFDPRVERRQLVEDEVDGDVVRALRQIDHAMERCGHVLALLGLGP